MTRSIVAVLAGYLTFAASVAVLFLVSGVDRHMAPTAAFAIGASMYGMGFAGLAGWITTRVAADRTDRHARLLAVLIAGLALVSLATQYAHGSVWSELATLLLMAPAARMGGALGTRDAVDGHA